MIEKIIKTRSLGNQSRMNKNGIIILHFPYDVHIMSLSTNLSP